MAFYSRGRRPLAEEEKSIDAAKARTRAMELLAGQELSSGQLYERLNRRYTQQTSAAVVAEMVQREYINDARYAETRAHALLAAKKSRRAAAQNLRQKGLAAGEIQQALDAVYTPDVSGEDPELEAAAALVEGHYRKKLEAGRRDLVIAALQRRGFSYSVIKEAIRRVEEGNNPQSKPALPAPRRGAFPEQIVKNQKHPSKEKESIIPYENCMYFPLAAPRTRSIWT